MKPNTGIMSNLRLTAMIHKYNRMDGGARPHIETYVQKLRTEDDNDFQPLQIKH
jgi:hypothetical protein